MSLVPFIKYLFNLRLFASALMRKERILLFDCAFGWKLIEIALRRAKLLSECSDHCDSVSNRFHTNLLNGIDEKNCDLHFVDAFSSDYKFKCGGARPITTQQQQSAHKTIIAIVNSTPLSNPVW